LVKFNDIDSEQKKKIENLASETNAYLIQMSNQSGDGISDVRAKACDILLDHRLTQKARDPKKAEAIINKLHVAEPKKRDNVVRDVTIPETVILGVKKVGPTIRQIQEEFGGAGKFYIPEEEHYILENEDWRYDKWPEFYLGKNVCDYYDPDIVKKLDALEREEERLVEIDMKRAEMQASDSEDEEFGVTVDDLRASVKKVKGKITIIKHRSMMKSKRKAVSKVKDLGEMTEALEKRGISVNKESLATRVKNPKRIGEIEANKDKKAKELLGEEYDSDDDDREMVDDEDVKKSEGERRGRKGRDTDVSKPKKLLGKRTRKNDDEMSMDSDEEEHSVFLNPKRTKTPAQRKASVQKDIRDRTASRREGSEPKRLPYKIVTEEQLRLAKKINSVFKHKI
jgi:nucleolar GTP-binding protein